LPCLCCPPPLPRPRPPEADAESDGQPDGSAGRTLVTRPDRADPTRPVWFGGVSGSLRFRAPVAADALVECIVGSSLSDLLVGLVCLAYLLSLLVWSACAINVEYPLVLSLLVRSACTINSEYPLLLSLFVWSACAINSEYPLLLIPFVWSACTINSADPRLALEQGKRSSPKTLCRGPNGVLTNPVRSARACAVSCGFP